jgi:hypothetical protein
MPLISSSIPNLINGVSQQPAALRLASQAEQVVNCLPSPVEGLRKRPPSNHIAKLFNGTAGTGRPFTTIVDRDGVIRYLILIQDNAIKVFGEADFSANSSDRVKCVEVFAEVALHRHHADDWLPLTTQRAGHQLPAARGESLRIWDRAHLDPLHRFVKSR